MKKLFPVFVILVLASLLLAACATPTAHANAGAGHGACNRRGYGSAHGRTDRGSRTYTSGIGGPDAPGAKRQAADLL